MAKYNLTPSWAKIAAAGTTCEIQNRSSVGIIVTTSNAVPTDNDDGILLFGPVPHRQYNLTSDLYARSTTPVGAVIEVLTGFSYTVAGNTSSAPSSGTVSVNNFPTTQNVFVVGGTSNVGNFPASQNVVVTSLSGTINVGNFPTSYTINNFPATQNVYGTVSVNNFPSIQNVSGNVIVTSLPLPPGAATAANQNTEITILNYIANNYPTIGQKTKAGSIPVTIASDQLVTVNTPIPANIVTGQIKIAVTGTAVNLPSAVLLNGIGIKAKATNANNGFVGSANVTNVYDGTGNGFALEPGATASFNIPNANSVWISGTAGDVFTYQGN